MARVKRAVNAQKKRREVLDAASGYRGQRSRLYRKAKEQLLHSYTYAYRDRQDRNRVKPARLEAPTFCQRFLNHVLPPGFVRIRRYGFWSNRTRENRAAMARKALQVEPPPPLQRESRSAACLRIFGKDPARCTKCPDGRLVIVARWSPTRLPMDLLLANLLPRAP